MLSLTKTCFSRHSIQLCPHARKMSGQALGFNEDNYQTQSRSELRAVLNGLDISFKESFLSIKFNVPHSLLGIAIQASASRQGVKTEVPEIHLNKTTGNFVIPGLALCGTWKDLNNYISGRNISSFPSNGENKHPFRPLPIHGFDVNPNVALWSDSIPVSSLDESKFNEIICKFNLPRALRPRDFAHFDVRIKFESMEMFAPVRYVAPNSPLLGARRISICPESGKVLEDHGLKKVTKNSQIFPFVFGLDKAYQSKMNSVVIVPSVLDAIAIVSQTKRGAPVCLADNSTTFPPEHLCYFENFAKVHFWFSNHIIEHESAQSFAKKLDARRCAIMNREHSNPLLCLKNNKNIDNLMKNDCEPCTNDYITNFVHLRDAVYHEMINTQENRGIQLKRFEELNKLMKGFRRGELSLFTGKTGTGKTTFLSEYSLDLCIQGINTLWGSFEVKNSRLAKTQLKQFAKLDLEKDMASFDVWADKFENLPMHYLTFHGAQKIDIILDVLQQSVYIYDITHIIIDNIQFMMGLSDQFNRFHSQDLIIEKFRSFATNFNVHISIVMHPRKEEDLLTSNSIFGGAKAIQEADNVFILQEESINLKKKRKYLQMVKNRYSGDLGIVPLNFNRENLTFSNMK